MNILFVQPPERPEFKLSRGTPLERDIFEARLAAAKRVARKRWILRLGLASVRSLLRRGRRRLEPAASIGEKQMV